jgi:hypothetical protein
MSLVDTVVALTGVTGGTARQATLVHCRATDKQSNTNLPAVYVIY